MSRTITTVCVLCSLLVYSRGYQDSSEPGIAVQPTNQRGLAASKSSKPWENESLVTQRIELGKNGGEHFNWKTPGQGSLDNCPAWIKDYIAFHQSTRGTPGAKYLINACMHKDACTHGLGDRLRGLLPTFQLAVAHKRVLLIAWPSPDPIEAFLEPAAMNYSLTSDLDIDLAQATRLQPFLVNLTHANAGPRADDARLWTIDTNRMVYRPDNPKSGEMNWFSRVSWEAHCIYRGLFQPSASLEAATDKVQKELLGNVDQPFVAVHLRMGNLEGENKDIPRGWDHFQGVVASYKCAMERDALLHGDAGFLQQSVHDAQDRDLRQLDGKPDTSNRPTRPRVLMMTDHEQLRGLVAKGMLSGMTGPSYIAHHLSYSKLLKNSKDGHESITMSIFVDLMLLTRAHCLVYSRSGFPKFAMAYAWHPCTAQLEYCIREMFPPVSH